MMKSYGAGMTLLCLLLFPACSRTVEVPVPVVVTIAPPTHLLSPTPEPLFQGTRNGDLLEWALQNRDALRRCNADKQAVRQAGER